MTVTAPVWDLDSALSELDHSSTAAAARLELAIADLAEFYDHNRIGGGQPLAGTPELAALFDEVLIRTDPVLRLERILSCWCAGRCWAWTARLPLPWLIDNTKQAADHTPLADSVPTGS